MRGRGREKKGEGGSEDGRLGGRGGVGEREKECKKEGGGGLIGIGRGRGGGGGKQEEEEEEEEEEGERGTERGRDGEGDEEGERDRGSENERVRDSWAGANSLSPRERETISYLMRCSYLKPPKTPPSLKPFRFRLASHSSPSNFKTTRTRTRTKRTRLFFKIKRHPDLSAVLAVDATDLPNNNNSNNK